MDLIDQIVVFMCLVDGGILFDFFELDIHNISTVKSLQTSDLAFIFVFGPQISPSISSPK